MPFELELSQGSVRTPGQDVGIERGIGVVGEDFERWQQASVNRPSILWQQVKRTGHLDCLHPLRQTQCL
jgi:hypothetical protein